MKCAHTGSSPQSSTYRDSATQRLCSLTRCNDGVVLAGRSACNHRDTLLCTENSRGARDCSADMVLALSIAAGHAC
jgi:hypothetical protein